MAISDWPEDQRPRERLMTYGPQALSDQELLAVFLRTGVQGKNALDLGREILDYFGSLGKLFSASPDALDHFKGIGPAKIALIQAVMELARRTSSEELKRGPVLVSSHAVNRFLQSQFAGEQSESFIGLFLDVQHRLIACERMFQGTLTRTCVYPREVARLALAHNAAAVIFAHNHPSGSPQPSAMDKALTAQLKELMQTIEVAMLDHVIVCGTRFWSFREKGLC
ncbi:MAG: repair protein RadC [Pseudomonadota bacterium]|jgi:DNA repair protein RadC